MTERIPPDISSAPFDAVIIGAGINGCGVARDAAMRGLRVLLLDKGDVASGTTSWSTRLIHGGLRYLEHGELGLVRESLRERETLLRRVAPHLVRPLPVLVPVYAGRRRGLLTIRAGVLAYDLLSFDKSLPRHRMLTPAAALAHAPGLDAAGLKGAALFYDAQIEYAERLALENALAARAHGATVLTYARVEHLMFEGDAVRGVEFKDLRGGTTHEARASVILNAAGPWVDEVLDGAGATGGSVGTSGEKLTGAAVEKLIGGTKGSHIVVRPFDGSPRVAVYAEAVADGRPFFVIPWDGKFLIGTTDELFNGDLNHVEAAPREIDYLIRETNRALPTARLTLADVLYTYAGVRPLPHVGARDQNDKEAGITRRHFIRPSRVRGLFSVVGGKLTTYRSLAEEAVDLLLRHLGKAPRPCTTAAQPLPGADATDFDAFSETFSAKSPLPPANAARLLKIYGTRAPEVMRLALSDPELALPISDETGSIGDETASIGGETGSIGAEVVFAFRDELAETLVDCLMRRTMVGLNGQVGLDAVEGAARVAQKFLGWDGERASREVEDYKRYVERLHPQRSRER